MLVGQHMRPGVGNNSHAVLLVQSDVADLDTTFTDTSRGGALHTVNGRGGIAHSTTQSQFAGSSIRFQAARWIDIADSVDFTLGGADWTIEGWMRADVVASQTLMGQADFPNTDVAERILFAASGRIYGVASLNGTVMIVAAGAAGVVGATAWTHMMLQRRGDVLSSYSNGLLTASAAIVGSVHDSSLSLYLGRYSAGAQQFTGYMEEVRITTGLARYPEAGFTPPNRMN